MAINTKSAPAETQRLISFCLPPPCHLSCRPLPEPAPFPCYTHCVSSLFYCPASSDSLSCTCLVRPLGPALRHPLSWCKASAVCVCACVLDLAYTHRPDHETSQFVRAADYSNHVPVIYPSQHLFGKLSVFFSIPPAHAALLPLEAVSSCFFKPFSPSLPLQHVSLPFPAPAPSPSILPLLCPLTSARHLGVASSVCFSSRLFYPRWPGRGCPESSIDQPHLPQAPRDSPRTQVPKVRSIGKSVAVEHLLAVPGALSLQYSPSGFSAPSLPMLRICGVGWICLRTSGQQRHREGASRCWSVSTPSP